MTNDTDGAEDSDANQKEFSCGIIHGSIEEAMVHAEVNLGFRRGDGKPLLVVLEPLLGAMFGAGAIVGWKSGARRRFRVDFEPDFERKNADAVRRKHGVHKGLQGVHVNEEDFTRKSRQKICHATSSSLLRAEHLWRRWTSKYGRRGSVTAEDVANVDK